MGSTPPVIRWLRQDLRLRDNPALTAAVESDHLVRPIYILDDVNAGGGLAKWQQPAAAGCTRA